MLNVIRGEIQARLETQLWATREVRGDENALWLLGCLYHMPGAIGTNVLRWLVHLTTCSESGMEMNMRGVSTSTLITTTTISLALRISSAKSQASARRLLCDIAV